MFTLLLASFPKLAKVFYLCMCSPLVLLFDSIPFAFLGLALGLI
jgi:hypothetical protein